jgi:hypothetical protein
MFVLPEGSGRPRALAPAEPGELSRNTPLLGRLCTDCNHRLGRELDEELARTGPTGFLRPLVGVEGRRSHSKVNPFHYRAMSAQQPTIMMMPVLHAEHKVLAEGYRDEHGHEASRPLRQVVVRTTTGDVAWVPFSRAWGADQLRAAIQARQLEGAAPFEVYIEDGESADSDSAQYFDPHRVLRAVFGPFREVTVYGGVGERTVSTVTIEAGINVRYMRALAKVAFHYFLWSCPMIRGEEPAFAGVRELISTGTGNYRDFVDYNAPQFIPILRDGLVPARTSHYFFSSLTRERAVSCVQFFVGPAGLTPPAGVRLATNPLDESSLRHDRPASEGIKPFDLEADMTGGPRRGAVLPSGLLL